MFTGIVEELGTVERIDRGRNSAVLRIRAAVVLDGLRIGDSVAVNGVCLTVVGIDGRGFSADVMHETLSRTALAVLRPGGHVNLERAMPANGRFGGHIVSGHIDATGEITRIVHDDNARWYTIRAGAPVMRYVVEKGSIAIDGVSLTVARVEDRAFSISAIPHTVSITLLGEKRVGDLVNLEADIIGKYVEKLIGVAAPPAAPSGGRLTREFLSKYGY